MTTDAPPPDDTSPPAELGDLDAALAALPDDGPAGEEQLAALLAEDDTPPGDLPPDPIWAEDREVFTGACVGGPWDGRTEESRFPRGFLLIDPERDVLWFYDRQADQTFACRNAEPVPVADEGDDSRWRAAEEADYDVRVFYADGTEPAAVPA